MCKKVIPMDRNDKNEGIIATISDDERYSVRIDENLTCEISINPNNFSVLKVLLKDCIDALSHKYNRLFQYWYKESRYCVKTNIPAEFKDSLLQELK